MTARLRFLILAAGFLLGSAIHGQAILTLELGYSNPGARSLGFGGAFVALADDATAAYANPAGLVQLTRPEISIEGRLWSYKTPYVFGGRASGTPTGIGIDTTPDLRWRESTADFSGLSFLSYVYPLKKWSLALYRHQLARFASAFATNGLFAEGSTYLETDRWIDRPGSTDLSVVSWAFSAARRITDAFSLGLTVAYHDVDMDLETTAYLPDDDTLAAFFAPSSYLPERSAWRTSTQVHDSNTEATLGFFWRTSERWSLGGFLRTGFGVSGRWDGWPGPASTADDRRDWHFTGNWEFPPVFGLGTAYNTRDGRVTLSFEWDYVAYSAIFEGDPDETIPDANELHLGGEYVFLQSRPLIALRLGVWLDPDHRVQSTIDDDLFSAVLSPGSDNVHYAFGFGAAFKRFQIDLAADFSDLRDTVSLSAIFSF
jgi:hypothetical protein